MIGDRRLGRELKCCTHPQCRWLNKLTQVIEHTDYFYVSDGVQVYKVLL